MPRFLQGQRGPAADYEEEAPQPDEKPAASAAAEAGPAADDARESRADERTAPAESKRALPMANGHAPSINGHGPAAAGSRANGRHAPEVVTATTVDIKVRPPGQPKPGPTAPGIAPAGGAPAGRLLAVADAKTAAAKESEAAAKDGAKPGEKSATSPATAKSGEKPSAAARGGTGAGGALGSAAMASASGAGKSLGAVAAAEGSASVTGSAAVEGGSSPAGAAGAPAAIGESGGQSEAGGGESEEAGDGGQDEAATEEKLEAASPEQAEADAAAEAEEDPEAAAAVDEEPPAEAPAAAPAAESGAETAVFEPADTNIAGTGPAGAAEATGAPSVTPLAVASAASASEPAGSSRAEPTAPVAEPADAQEPADAASAEQGLDPAEQRAAMESIASSGGAGGSEPGGGGGGGGAAIEEQPEPEAPDVSGQEPESAIASVENLPPATLVGAIGGVSSAVDASVARKRETLAANPPEMERPSGSPVTKSGSRAVGGDAGGTGAKRAVAKGKEGAPQVVPPPKPVPVPPPSPAARAPEPKIATPGGTQLGAEEASAIQSSVRNLPTSDPGLNMDAGPAPRVVLAGDADPAQVQDQRAKLNDSAAEAKAEGRRDAAQPMGEADIYPTVQPETLRAQPGAGGAAGGGEAAAGGAGAAGPAGTVASGGGDADAAAAIIAKEQNGPELKAAAAQAKADMAAERTSHAEKETEERAKNQKEIAQLEQENSAEQSAERRNAQAEVAKARGDWTEEQQSKVDDADEEAQREEAKGDETIAAEEERANEEAQSHVEAGNEEAAEHRAHAEEEADRKRREAEQESDGVFGWLASKAKAFFDRIKRGITAVFDAARKLVKAAIEKAKQLAVAVIEKARKAIVAAIRAVGAALIAIGDRLLAAFPALRDKWRKFIRQKVDAAEAAVNRLAEALKAGVQKLLDLLGKALDAALGLLQKGLLAVVEAYSKAVQGIIKAAKAVAEALGAFIALIKDVAANPGGWIRNLGAAVVDGIRNHLWKAFKAAVKNWFNSKLEEVLGIGGMIWGLLKKGGIAAKEVGQMAWDGLKAAIPVALITILVEKLVAMIVPAAGAVMAIIEGLQAAWGTVSRIIAAFAKFFAFLKAVKGGGAGPQFADAVAAAAVVVIDFVSNWVLKKIRRPAGKIGGKIKAIAQKIAQRLKRGASRVGKALKKAGKKVLAPFKKAKAKLKAWRDKRRASRKKKDDPAKKKADKEKAKRERLEKAVRAIQPALEKLLSKGVGRMRLNAQLMYWRVRHRLSRLSLEGNRIVATINPSADLTQVKELDPQKLGKALQGMLAQVEAEFFQWQEQNRTRIEQQQVKEAEAAASSGSKEHAGLPTSEQVPFFRRILSGKIELPPPTRIIKAKPGGREFRSPIVRPGEPGFSTYANPNAAGRVTPSGLYVIGAGDYPLATPTLGAPSRRGLVQVVEPARGGGMFAASQVTEGLLERGAINEKDAFSGKFAPMAAKGSARAAAIDEGILPPSSDPATHREDEAARRHRYQALRQIFIKLAESLERPPVHLFTGSAEQAALDDVARAFLAWARANFVKKNVADANATAAEFRAKLLAYLQARNAK